jgi:hypothetical protein
MKTFEICKVKVKLLGFRLHLTCRKEVNYIFFILTDQYHMALPVSIPTRGRCLGYVESGKQADRNDDFQIE